MPNYRLMKKNFGLEYYLNTLSNDLRTIMSKFRMGTHNLPISDKRFDPPDERNLCPLCHSDTGDEYYYIMSCLAFEYIRPKYISDIWANKASTHIEILLAIFL